MRKRLIWFGFGSIALTLAIFVIASMAQDETARLLTSYGNTKSFFIDRVPPDAPRILAVVQLDNQDLARRAAIRADLNNLGWTVGPVPSIKNKVAVDMLGRTSTWAKDNVWTAIVWTPNPGSPPRANKGTIVINYSRHATLLERLKHGFLATFRLE